MKRIAFAGGLLALIVAFALGYWPQRERALTAEAEVARLQASLGEAEDKVRLAEVLGLVLQLADTVAARNYGDAATQSSTLYDRVRMEVSRATRPASKSALEEVLLSRDQVTATIAQNDPEVSSVLTRQMVTLRKALGLPAS